MALLAAVNLALIGLVVALDLGAGVDNWSLVRDANAIAGQPAYFGAYSYLGVLVWAAGAAIALFAAGSMGPAADAPVRAVLRVGGFYMAMACLDDLYMLHESLAGLGVPEVAVMALHAAGVGLVALLAWRVRDRAPWPLMILAMGALMGTTLVDLLPAWAPGQVLAEEALKLTGISALAVFLVVLSRWALARRGAV